MSYDIPNWTPDCLQIRVLGGVQCFGQGSSQDQKSVGWRGEPELIFQPLVLEHV